MKNLLLCFLFFVSAECVSAANFSADYQRADSVKVVNLLKRAASQKNMGNKVIYVETVLALTRCLEQNKLTFAAFCHNLRMIRYNEGVVSYPSRQHYFTYWIQQNEKKGIVKDIQAPNPPFSAVQKVNTNYMTTHIELYPMLLQNKSWISHIRAMETSINGLKCYYIPKAGLTDSKLLRQTIHNGDIIAIITSLKGLDTSHIGIAVWHKDGLHMLNASSIHHKVVEESMLLRAYMLKHPSQLGIRIARPL